jgi:hypothetical protein
MKNLHTLLLALLVTLLAVGCKSGKQLSSESRFLSAKVHLTLPMKGETLTVTGTLRLEHDRCVQLSLLMPILHSEVARLEVTPQHVLILDRMGKRYMLATRDELKDVLPKKLDFARLEKMLRKASQPGAKAELTASELGIPAWDGARIALSSFSDREITMTLTPVPARYTRVDWHELLRMLTK